MEHIPNYDNWKTTPPDDPDTTYCVKCGAEIYKVDNLKAIDGYRCENCMRLEE